MAGWAKQIFAVNLIFGDLEHAKTFYREILGLPLLDDEEDVAILRLGDTFVALRHDPGHESAPSAEQLRLAQTGAGQFSIVVEDVDAVAAELEEHGVTFISGPADRDWGMRTLTFADPGGHIWGIAQDLP
jgi:catechol 2,3-dioxygenase-like lactoylglutathione lyase family enzyme